MSTETDAREKLFRAAAAAYLPNSLEAYAGALSILLDRIGISEKDARERERDPELSDALEGAVELLANLEGL